MRPQLRRALRDFDIERPTVVRHLAERGAEDQPPSLTG